MNLEVSPSPLWTRLSWETSSCTTIKIRKISSILLRYRLIYWFYSWQLSNWNQLEHPVDLTFLIGSPKTLNKAWCRSVLSGTTEQDSDKIMEQNARSICDIQWEKCFHENPLFTKYLNHFPNHFTLGNQGNSVNLQCRVSVHRWLDVTPVHGSEDDHDGVKLLLPHLG